MHKATPPEPQATEKLFCFSKEKITEALIAYLISKGENVPEGNIMLYGLQHRPSPMEPSEELRLVIEIPPA